MNLISVLLFFGFCGRRGIEELLLGLRMWMVLIYLKKDSCRPLFFCYGVKPSYLMKDIVNLVGMLIDM